MVIDVVKVPTLLSSGIIVAVNRFATVATPVKSRGAGPHLSGVGPKSVFECVSVAEIAQLDSIDEKEEAVSSKWTFLSHHAHVLIALADNPELTMDELAKIEGITTRSVVNVLNDLVEAGYLTKERQGRNNHYTINLDSPLRHQTSADRKVGDLIGALGQLHH